MYFQIWQLPIIKIDSCDIVQWWANFLFAHLEQDQNFAAQIFLSNHLSLNICHFCMPTVFLEAQGIQ